MKVQEELEFTAFVNAHGDSLLRFARLLILDRGDAEDALQTALLRLTAHWHRGLHAPEAYVRRILVNLAKDGARRRHLVPVPVERDALPEPVTVDVGDAYSAQARLDLLLDIVPPRQRIAIVLRVIEGCTEADTAQLMGCSVGTVKSNLARGLERLRSLYPNADLIPEG